MRRSIQSFNIVPCNPRATRISLSSLLMGGGGGERISTFLWWDGAFESDVSILSSIKNVFYRRSFKGEESTFWSNWPRKTTFTSWNDAYNPNFGAEGGGGRVDPANLLRFKCPGVEVEVSNWSTHYYYYYYYYYYHYYYYYFSVNTIDLSEEWNTSLYIAERSGYRFYNLYPMDILLLTILTCLILEQAQLEPTFNSES